MITFLQHVVDGLSVGSTYALLALGLTLVYGVMGLINFAYGMIIIWAGYALAVATTLDLPFWIGALSAVSVATGLSLVLGVLAFRPFLNAPPATLLITSFGVELALQATAVLVFGEPARVIATPMSFGHVWRVHGLRLPAIEVGSIVLAVLVIAALDFLLRHTALGLELRATAENRSIARLFSVRPGRVVLVAFAISGAIAGLVSIPYFARLGAVTPRGDLYPTINAFIAIALGGLGSIRGAIVGGLALGMLQTIFDVTLPSSILGYQDAFVFAVIILILVWRPGGLSGRVPEFT